MTTSSNSCVKFKGDKSRAMPFLAEFFVCRCALCWPSYCPLTHGESQVDFKKIHSLLRSFCSTPWRQHKWASCEWTGRVCSCRAPLAMNWKSFILIYGMYLFPLNYLFSPFLNAIYILLLLSSRPCTGSLPFGLHSRREKRVKLTHFMTVQNLFHWLQFP